MAPAVAPSGAPLAGFGDRLVAHIIDSVILFAVGMVLAIPAYALFLASFLHRLDTQAQRAQLGAGEQPNLDTGPLIALFFAIFGAILLVYLIIGYIYSVEMMFRSGQTPGKRVMKIKVAPIDPAGTLTRGMATKRFLIGNLVGLAVPVFFWLDGLWQLWDKPYCQCLHDKVGQTVVVKVGRP
jgi:uncharacterized RDD family membrane protein YckC